jgi:hypothetical protein
LSNTAQKKRRTSSWLGVNMNYFDSCFAGQKMLWIAV